MTFGAAVIKAQQRVRELEWHLEQKALPKLQAENKVLKEKLTAMTNEFHILQWYLSVMEDGVDTREIVKEYYDLRKKNKRLEKTSKATITQLATDKMKL